MGGGVQKGRAISRGETVAVGRPFCARPRAQAQHCELEALRSGEGLQNRTSMSRAYKANSDLAQVQHRYRLAFFRERFNSIHGVFVHWWCGDVGGWKTGDGFFSLLLTYEATGTPDYLSHAAGLPHGLAVDLPRSRNAGRRELGRCARGSDRAHHRPDYVLLR